MDEEIKQKQISISTFIPGYLITAKLGEGGMGAVYKARQLSLNREVAIKILSSKQNKDPEYVARFEREAQIAGKLNHKNIVSVLETGVCHHHHYYVMEYVEGASLHKILRKRKTLPEQEALKIIEEVAEALEHADKHKIIHRDIKPDNIMLANDGHAKLCDLGIAKQIQGELAKTLTATGEGFYTAPYVSPEQFEGKKLDIRSDIYSLGVTLYEMVTGQLPFTGETSQEVAANRLTRNPTLPKKLNPQISQNLNNLILRMMARSRDQRYANPTQLIKAIHYLKVGGHISAPPNPYIKWAALAAVALIAVITITIFFSSGGALEKESQLFNDAISKAQKLLDERKYSDAIKIAQSFPATDEELKVKVKDFVGKINTTASEGLNALIAYSNSLFTKGDFDNAVNALQNAKSLYDATDSNNNLSTAIAEVSKRVEEKKAEAKRFYDSADAKSNRKDYKGAIEDYDKAIQINPDYAEAYSDRGDAKENLGDYKGAIEDCDKAISISPNYANAYFNRGTAKYKLDDNKGAIADWQKTISINPNYTLAYGNRGIAKGRTGDNKGAIEDFDKAISINPNDVMAYVSRGVAKGMLGDWKGAIEDFDKAISMNPNDAETYLNRGVAKYYLDDNKGAIADWEKAIELNPSYKSELQPSIDSARAKLK